MSQTLTLIRRARSGSSSAFTLLFQRHRARLRALVAARMSPALRSRAEAEDIVQETYLEASKQFATFTPEVPQAFYRWLTRIAGFKLKEAERALRAKKRGMPEHLHGEPPAEQSTATGRAQRGERAVLIAEAIDRLPASQAEALRHRYLEGCSLAETAERVGRSEAAVKALVGRGLTALARSLAPPTD